MTFRVGGENADDNALIRNTETDLPTDDKAQAKTLYGSFMPISQKVSTKFSNNKKYSMFSKNRPQSVLNNYTEKSDSKSKLSCPRFSLKSELKSSSSTHTASNNAVRTMAIKVDHQT